ncbi:MAG: hypothetical protein H0W68_05540 [Gemmatimonadaceae bacterium]|nr:hypothetical protein [Gemmatimonadaceae bacterium]
MSGFCSPYGLYSHTILALALLGTVLGGGVFLASGSRTMGALVTGLVLLHIPPDMVTGHKLLWPGGELHGLGLYGQPWADFVVELPIALGGWWCVRRVKTAPRWARSGWAAVAIVLVQGTIDVAGSYYGGFKPSACGARARAPSGRLLPTAAS